MLNPICQGASLSIETVYHLNLKLICYQCFSFWKEKSVLAWLKALDECITLILKSKIISDF